jgi:hypothetical protein
MHLHIGWSTIKVYVIKVQGDVQDMQHYKIVRYM